MLGIRLKPEEERRLERHAREAGRPKSVLARDWIMDRLAREEIDELIRHASKLHGADRARIISASRADATAAHLRALDAEDDGYDWGAEGPPPCR